MTKSEKKWLKQLETLLHERGRKLKDGYGRLERFLKQEVKLGRGKPLLEYDPNSPFSYLTAFLRDRTVASVAPSTKYVINRVVKALEPEKLKVLVEFGPAEGVITRRLLARLPQDATIVAIERNENFVRALRRIHDPRLRVVHGDVRDVDEILRGQGLAGADAVVSGIPFSFFTPPERLALLEKIRGLLNPRGRFVAYQFTTHLIPLLRRFFQKVDTQFEIRNLPPHFVFTCFK